MTIQIDLPADVERLLAAEAASQGLSLPEYALRILSTGRAGPRKARSGKELVAYWKAEKLIGTRTDITDSQQHARQLRQQAESRRRQ